MKHIKKIAAILVVLMLFMTFSFSAMAEGTKKGSKTSQVASTTETVKSDNATSSSGEVDISTASPEEIEEIGMAAMLEAGLVSDGDLNIVDVTPGDESLSDAAAQNGVASVLGIVGFVISIISFIGVGVLYFFSWKSGMFKINTSRNRKSIEKER